MHVAFYTHIACQKFAWWWREMERCAMKFIHLQMTGEDWQSDVQCIYRLKGWWIQ